MSKRPTQQWKVTLIVNDKPNKGEQYIKRKDIINHILKQDNYAGLVVVSQKIEEYIICQLI